ncbi:TPA: DUF3226 domain-containing protein [Citrobacter freundii]|uniref:DUF3226 domain-containing protein n=1 Tax=Raoultella ornithinolytica TaxID=54291 RepID=UPI0039B6DD52
MQPRKQGDYKKFIFVEGDDDFHFICNLLEIENISDVFVEKVNGKTKLKVALKAFTKLSAFESAESLFVIVDADTSFNDSEKSVASIFSELSITSPKKHTDITTHGSTKISFFIMPGNGENGAIEDLVLKHASNKKVFTHITDLFHKIKEEEVTIAETDPEYKYPSNEKKAKVQVYLSCNHDSDSRIGTSMKKKTIDTSDPCFLEIKTFLSKI